jgi:hypothetical protein
MRSPPNGGPAFARPDALDHEGLTTFGDPGMSLRDWFAGQAMAGLMANSDLPDLFKGGLPSRKLAEVVYVIADAMLAEREKGVHDATP